MKQNQTDKIMKTLTKQAAEEVAKHLADQLLPPLAEAILEGGAPPDTDLTADLDGRHYTGRLTWEETPSE